VYFHSAPAPKPPTSGPASYPLREAFASKADYAGVPSVLFLRGKNRISKKASQNLRHEETVNFYRRQNHYSIHVIGGAANMILAARKATLVVKVIKDFCQLPHSAGIFLPGFHQYYVLNGFLRMNW
jgi:hypothetical protein